MSCSRSRRPPPGGGARASPARRGSSPASRPARRPRSARGCRWTCCPAARAWRSPPTPPREDDRFAGCLGGRADRGGVRVGPGRGPRRRPQARRGRRAGPAQPRAARTRSSPRDQVAYALGESRARADEPDGHWPSTWTPGCPAPRRRWTTARSPGTRPRSSPRATALLDDAEARAAEAEVLDRAGRLTPGGLRAAIARAVMEVAPKKAKEAAGDRGEVRAGGAVGRGLRQRRADGPRAAAGRGAGRGPADHRLGGGAAQGRAGGRHGRAPRPRLPGPAPGQGLPPRARPAPAPAGAPGAAPARVRRAGHPDRPAGHPGRPGGPARRAGRAGPGRPVAGPRPGRRRRAQPEDHLVRDRHRRARATPSATAAPGPNPRATGNAPDPARRADRVLLHPGQPGRPARRVRHLAAAHPRTRAGPDHHPRPARPPTPATTGTRPGATTPGSSSGTCPRSGTPPAPARSAGGPPPSATSSTTPRTKRAAGPACATPARSAVTTTGSSSTPGGRSTSSPTAPSGGPPRPGAPTTTEPTRYPI